jgi:hypothetical protein
MNPTGFVNSPLRTPPQDYNLKMISFIAQSSVLYRVCHNVANADSVSCFIPIDKFHKTIACSWNRGDMWLYHATLVLVRGY